MIGRAAVAGAIRPIGNNVAVLDEVVDEAAASADAHHVHALAAAAMHHHDGIRMLLLGRDHVLDRHLAHRDGAVGHGFSLSADPESACGRLVSFGGFGCCVP